MSTALIVEGGGMRGAYAAGALLGLAERGVAFDRVWATSSGACSAAYFVAGGGTEGIRIWEDLVSGGQLIRFRNLFAGRGCLDLDYLIRTFRERVPLDWGRLAAAQSQLWVVLTDCRLGEAVYHRVRGAEVFDVLCAATALPFATRGYARVDGVDYADGGITDSIPFAAAIAAGATEVTVILTHAPGYRMRPFPLGLARLAFPRFPRVARALRDRYRNYNGSLDLLASPPPGVSLRLIRPSALALRRFTRARSRLRAAVSQGRRDALESLPGSPEPPEPHFFLGGPAATL
jgi:predicted patatin/cPLA2 family phospholipase